MKPPDEQIIMEYDDLTESYYVVWEPMRVIGMGKTEREALDDLKAAANFGINTLVEMKLAEYV